VGIDPVLVHPTRGIDPMSAQSRFIVKRPKKETGVSPSLWFSLARPGEGRERMMPQAQRC